MTKRPSRSSSPENPCVSLFLCNLRLLAAERSQRHFVVARSIARPVKSPADGNSKLLMSADSVGIIDDYKNVKREDNTCFGL